MKTAFLALASLAVLAPAPARAQEPGSGPSAEVPELAALSGFVGRWDTRSEARRIEGVAEAGSFRGTAEASWIHGGRFVRQTWAITEGGAAAGFNGSSIMTYDPARKAYRVWSFMSNGTVGEGEGTYDAKAKAFRWKTRDSAGMQTTTQTSFATDGEENWSIVITDGDGRVVADMKGTNTRRKD
jgi:hypothetical protein